MLLFLLFRGLQYLISSVSRTPLPLERYAHLYYRRVHTHKQLVYYCIRGRTRAHATHKYENTLTQTHAHGLIRIDQCNCRQLYIVAGYLYTDTHPITLSIYIVNIHIYIILYTPRRSIQRARCQQHIYDDAE